MQQLSNATLQPLRQINLDSYIERGRSNVFAEMIYLTPQLAAEILDKNPANRNIAAHRVTIYATDIKEGRWSANGEAIIISDEGTLNDGQHRCAAVIEADIPIHTLAVFGVARETRHTTDTGASKNAGNFLAMDGVKNAATVSGIARLALAYETFGQLNKASRVSNAAVVEYYHRNAEEIDKVTYLAQKYKKQAQYVAPPSLFGACWFLFRKINKGAADQFMSELAAGAMIGAGDAAYVARNRLTSLGRAKRHTRAEIIFHAWNGYRRGGVVKLIRVAGQLPPLV